MSEYQLQEYPQITWQVCYTGCIDLYITDDYGEPILGCSDVELSRSDLEAMIAALDKAEVERSEAAQ